MFRLPYMQEIRQKQLALEVDLCTAGDLRDPSTDKHMQKSLTIMTSSAGLYHDFDGLKCQGNHEHQQIAGSCQVNGQHMLRTVFSENYPRKFARRLAKSLCRVRIPRELPYLQQQEECLWSWTLAGEGSTNERLPKRQRLASQARLKLSRACDIDQLPWGKRLKCTIKTTPQNTTEQWQSIFQGMQNLAPRVGKIEITDSQLLSQIQALLDDKVVKRVMLCRGTNRTLGPPDNLIKGEAPYRRCIFVERNTGKIKADEAWEEWEGLSKRQLIRASHPCRLNMTVFATNPNVPAPARESRPESPLQNASNSAAIPERPEESKNPQVETAASPNPSVPLTESQQADVDPQVQSDHFKSLTKEEQQSLIRAHKNLGHPHAEKFSSIIRQQGFRPEVARAALELRCSVCQSQRAPKTGAPGNLRDELDFNDRVHVDGFTWTSSQGIGYHVYHFVDSATSFQVACVSPSRAADAFLEYFLQSWLMWAGTPHELIVDAGTELNADEVSTFAQAHNIHMTTISTEAHFQNGKAERHGSILQSMLTKYEKEHAIQSYQDLKQGLWWCVQAKNAYSIKRGYSPEILVLGKQTRLPGSVCSDELLPAHMLADSESAQGVQFRQQLARRESARKAFVQTDHDAALRRAILRRSHGKATQYAPGEWVMVWRQGKGAYPSQWTGPMKVVVHENAQTIWTTMASKLYRSALEHTRPVSAMEAKKIVILPQEPSVSTIAQQLPLNSTERNNPNPSFSPPIPPVTDVTLPAPLPIIQNNLQARETTSNPHHSSPPSELQPDTEPEVPGSYQSNAESVHPDVHAQYPLDPERDMAQEQVAQNTPLPVDDDLCCDALHSLDTELESFSLDQDQGWLCEVYVTEHDIEQWKQEDNPYECVFLASAAKRQRAEVKLTSLGPEEKAEFQKAKEHEIQNWLKTGTISRILRNKVPPNQILRCRWILTWKPIDDVEREQLKGTRNHKAKARLVILGYLDPKITEVLRDSPTLGRHSKMLLLRLIASKGWRLRSFDVKAAFLQGKNQKDRTLAIEPVEEIIKMMKLSPYEVCKLEKGAYGLVDAPFMWFQAILEELQKLHFEQSPFDPCLFILRNPSTQEPDGILGLHVDDGLCAGNSRFQEKLDLLEQKYPFGSKRTGEFTFTGIDMMQTPEGTIHLSQSKYIRAIEPIKLSTERRKQLDQPVTEDERQQLRALIGSIQYAAAHTRPDLSSRLSMLQSAINSATVETLTSANQALHEAKKHHDVTIKIQPIATSDLRFLAFSDASFASKSNPSSHTGSLIMATHKDIGKNTTCPVNPMSWGCKKIQRVVTSTLAAETTSLNSVLDQLSWVRLCWAWILNSKVQWKNPTQAFQTLPETYTTATLRAQEIPESLAATDCKSLYDLVTRTAVPSCTEFRTQLTARSIKDLLAEGVALRTGLLFGEKLRQACLEADSPETTHPVAVNSFDKLTRIHTQIHKQLEKQELLIAQLLQDDEGVSEMLKFRPVARPRRE
eukprot:s2832_g2.t1